jgi:hypothetical protein
MTSASQFGLNTPVRNHYYYGKLLDADHFELETNYGNAKRWLLNRLVTGHGVVCGLNVKTGHESEPHVLKVAPGLALDGWGREIIVPHEASVTIPSELIPPATDHTVPGSANPAGGNPAQAQQQHPPPHYTDVHVVLCYQERQEMPEPVLTGDCGPDGPCVPGEIRERYYIDIRKGKVHAEGRKCHLPDFFQGGEINYPELARYVTQNCHKPPDDPCVLLANVRVSAHPMGRCKAEEINVTVRPIVYTNELLYHLILSLADTRFER